MKNIILLTTFILSACFANAQHGSFDKRLLSKFSETELKEMQLKNPDTYAYWNFYTANAYQITDLPSEKSNAHEIKGTIKLSDINSVNIFDLHFTPSVKDYQYYRIEGSNKLLVIISEEQIKDRYKKSVK